MSVSKASWDLPLKRNPRISGPRWLWAAHGLLFGGTCALAASLSGLEVIGWMVLIGLSSFHLWTVATAIGERRWHAEHSDLVQEDQSPVAD